MSDTNCLNSNMKAEAAEPSISSTAGGEESVSRADEQDQAKGWIFVVCQLLITANTWGVNGSFGVYLAHYLSTNTFPEISEVAYSFIGGLSMSQITFIAPLVKYANDKLGNRPSLFIGILLETCGLVAASFATRGWHLFLTQGLLFGWGSSFLYVSNIGVIPQLFTRHRGIANGVAAAGSGLGGLVYSLASEVMISRMGIAWSLRITAVSAAVINSVCALLIRYGDHHTRQGTRAITTAPLTRHFDCRLLRRPQMIWIILWAYLSIMGYTVVLFSLPDNALTVGLSSRQASVIGALTNLGMAVGRPLVGFFGDRVGRTHMITAATFASGFLCLCLWIFSTSFAVLAVFAALAGTVIGTYWATVGPLLADTFGTELLQPSLSILWAMIVLPTTFAEAIGLALRRPFHPVYLHVQIFSGCSFLAAGVCMVVLLHFWPPVPGRNMEDNKPRPTSSRASDVGVV